MLLAFTGLRSPLSLEHGPLLPYPAATLAAHRSALEFSGLERRSQQGRMPLPSGFRFNRVVAIVAYDRFECFRQAVEGLRQAWGSDSYTITISIDGPPRVPQHAEQAVFSRRGWESVVRYAGELQWLARHGRGFHDVVVNVSDENIGRAANTQRAVAGAFTLSDFVVVLEDDVVLEADALRWFEWHVTSGLIFRRTEIAVATCWSTSFPYDTNAVEGLDIVSVAGLGLLDKFMINPWATPWGWATWRHTWDAVGPGWSGSDLELARRIKARGWFETIPLVSRCNNIGSKGQKLPSGKASHIHQRTITSASFPNIEDCAYAELARANYTGRLAKEQVYKYTRSGIFKDRKFVNTSLADLWTSIESFVAAQPDLSQWVSSC